jgi:tRNA threonylcarbamoyl adenosine modification protein (Sua5/YciO/YrdC/YwlC family)/tRNA threonylcarbamoyl adenosine modification protein YjeE
VSDKKMAEKYVFINEMAEHVYDQFLPGPVTVVSKSRGKVAKRLESVRQTLGVRVPDHPLPRQLAQSLGKPITATSANTSGQKPPYSLRGWRKYTSGKKQAMVDLFIDAGELPERQPSTVVDTTLNELAVVRAGAIELSGEMRNEVRSMSESQTQELGERLMRRVKNELKVKPVILALQGELGAGKTQFAKGVAKALGIAENVVSPTYNIVKEYLIPVTPGVKQPQTPGVLYHIDTWRLHEGQELLDLGFEGMLSPGNVVVVEWLEKVRPLLETARKKAKVVWVTLEQVDETIRLIKYMIDE